MTETWQPKRPKQLERSCGGTIRQFEVRADPLDLSVENPPSAGLVPPGVHKSLPECRETGGYFPVRPLGPVTGALARRSFALQSLGLFLEAQCSIYVRAFSFEIPADSVLSLRAFGTSVPDRTSPRNRGRLYRRVRRFGPRRKKAPNGVLQARARRPVKLRPFKSLERR